MAKKVKYDYTHEDKLYNHKQYIMDNFDFEKCHNTMKFLNWEWWDVGVPSVVQLRDHLDKNLNLLIQGVLGRNIKRYDTSCGGIRVRCTYYKKEDDFVMEAMFVLTEWSSGDE